ncbi:glutathione S-transferase family protein [Intestinirhabdus alba]|jgi:glutathione S-transferase|uniref:Glutathione S-transferase GstB n=1 Tax=Intestinirhabdus alba TaxID=2899544 RepID=A0A6L6INX4_9ENTR|nr:glutathione S-transferase family protein [Intestinirhabdus alba]MTH47644.1 glutathione S-transferase [Intestinirhabdus alba]
MITLWGRNNSTNVKKVLWTLEELDLPCQHIPAGGRFGLNHDADYLAMNPNGLVPLLRDDERDLLLWESNTIVRYLAAQYGQGRLWIDAPARRAEGEKWMDWANQTLAPAHGVIVLNLVRTPPEKRDREAIDDAVRRCDALLAIPDEALAKRRWLSGDDFGPGDIAVAPFVYNLLNVGLSWTPRPHLARWYQQLSERPAFRKVVMIPVS